MRPDKKHDKIVLKYLKKTGRFKTLEELEKSLDRKQKKGSSLNQLLRVTVRKKASKAQFCDTESARKKENWNSSDWETSPDQKERSWRKENCRHSR